MMLAREARFVDLDGPVVWRATAMAGCATIGSLVIPPDAALWVDRQSMSREPHHHSA